MASKILLVNAEALYNHQQGFYPANATEVGGQYVDLLAFPLVGKHAIDGIIDISLADWGREVRVRGRPAVAAIYERMMTRAVAYKMDLVDDTAAKRNAWPAVMSVSCTRCALFSLAKASGSPREVAQCRSDNSRTIRVVSSVL